MVARTVAGVSPDARRVIAGQAVRAFGYGFTAVLLGSVLAARGYGPVQAGVLLALVVAGTAGASLVVGWRADVWGRRRCYLAVFAGLAVTGAVVATGAPYWLLLVVALSGTLSTDVVDNGPATTLEQVILAAEDRGSARLFGLYNAAGAGAGAVGALCAGLPGSVGDGVGPERWFLVLTVVGLAGVVLATGLSPAVDAASGADKGAPLGLAVGPTRTRLPMAVRQMSALFAVDAAGGGLVTTGFLSYLFTQRYGASATSVGVLFFAVSLLQMGAVLLAPVLARRFGLVATMVGTHLPSNVLLAAVAFAPTFSTAAVLLLARTTLSQMDVPTRQALVMSVVEPAMRPRAAAATNAARYTVRPFGPLLAGAVQQLGVGLPLLVAGTVKGSYDLLLWRWAARSGLGHRVPGPEVAA